MEYDRFEKWVEIGRKHGQNWGGYFRRVWYSDLLNTANGPNEAVRRPVFRLLGEWDQNNKKQPELNGVLPSPWILTWLRAQDLPTGA